MKFSAVSILISSLNFVIFVQSNETSPTQGQNEYSIASPLETHPDSAGLNWEELINSRRDQVYTARGIPDTDHPFWLLLGKSKLAPKAGVVLSRSKRDITVAIQRVLGSQFLSIECPEKSFTQCTKSAPTKFYLYPLEGSLSTFIIHDGSMAIGAISKISSFQYTQTSELEYVYSNPRYHWTAKAENGFSKFINVATGLALDANGAGWVYLHPNITGNYYQNWKLREWSSNIINLGPEANWEVPVNDEGYRLQSNVTRGFVSLRCNQGNKKACAVPQHSSPLPIQFTPVNGDYSDDQRGTSVHIHDFNKDDNTKYAIGVSDTRIGSGRVKVEVEDLRMVDQDQSYHWLVVKEQGDNRRFVNIATGYILAIQTTEPSVIATSERGSVPLILTRLLYGLSLSRFSFFMT